MGTDVTTPLSPGMHTVEIKGTAHRYHVRGSGPVLLVHPGGPGFAWEYLRMPVVEERLTTVYLEPIGTGGSGRLETHPHGYTRDVYVQALDGLIDHLGLPKVHVLGHSHGGFVAQRYALEHADRLAGIILCESAPAVGPEHFAEAARNMEEFGKKHSGRPELQEVLDAWQSVPFIKDDKSFTTSAKRLLPAFFADYWGRQEEFAPAMAGLSGSYISGLDDCMAPVTIDDRDTLGSISTPTLVVVGRHDFICGPRWSQEISELIPGSELVVLENSGHFGYLEEPDRFADVVAGFVARHGE